MDWTTMHLHEARSEQRRSHAFDVLKVRSVYSMRSAYNSLSLVLCGLIKSIRFSGYSRRIISPLLANNAFKIDTEIMLPNPRSNVFITSTKQVIYVNVCSLRHIHSTHIAFAIGVLHSSISNNLKIMENLSYTIQLLHAPVQREFLWHMKKKMLHPQRQRYIWIMWAILREFMGDGASFLCTIRLTNILRIFVA